MAEGLLSYALEMPEHHRERKEMLSDEERLTSVNRLLQQQKDIKDKLPNLNGAEHDQAKSALDDINTSLIQIYHPIHNPGVLQKDWDTIKHWISRKPTPAVLPKTTQQGTPEATLSMPGPMGPESVTLDATPAYQTVAPERATMSPQQRQGEAQREQAHRETAQLEASAPLSVERQGIAQARAEDAAGDERFRWMLQKAEQLGVEISDEDKRRMVESAAGITPVSASRAAKPDLQDFILSDGSTASAQWDTDRRVWTYKSGEAIPANLLRDAKVVGKKIKPEKGPVVPYAGSKTKFAQTYLDPYTKRMIAWNPTLPPTRLAGSTTTRTMVDSFGVKSTTSGSTQPNIQGTVDLSGITQLPETYSGEELPASMGSSAPASPAASPAPAAASPTAENVSLSDAMVVPHPKGLITPGNIPIWNRPVIQNDDGTHSSELSIGIGDDQGHEVLIPTIVNGKFLTPDGKMPPGPVPKEGEKPSPEWKALFDNAVTHYRTTGEHLGMFDNAPDANAYASMLHSRKPHPAHAAHGAQHAVTPPAAPAAAPASAPAAPPATPQQLKAQVPNVPVVDALHHPDGPGVYGSPRTTDTDGHIPADAKNPDGTPVNPGLREAADQLLDGMDIEKIQLPSRDKAFAAGLARLYGWGRGPFTPRELKAMQNAQQFLDMVNNSHKFMALLDSGLFSRTKAAFAEKDPSKEGWFSTILHQMAVTGGDPDQQEYLRLNQALTGTIGGLSSVVRPGRPTEATINRLRMEIPGVMESANSRDGKERIKNLKREIELALRQGVPAPTKPVDKTKQVQSLLNGGAGQIPKGTVGQIGDKFYSYNGTGDPDLLDNWTEVKQ